MSDVMRKLRDAHCSRPSGDKHAMHLIHADMCCACEVERLTTEYSALKDATLPFFTWIYNQGYNQGHHDTVEGMYTDVLPEDSSEYHDDIVMELLAEYARDVWVASDSGSPKPNHIECSECGEGCRFGGSITHNPWCSQGRVDGRESS